MTSARAPLHPHSRTSCAPSIRQAFRVVGLLTAVVGRMAAQDAGQGRISGRVVDRETARPLSAARVSIEGQPVVAETDMDGRFRTAPIPAGLYTLRAALIGFRAARVDSVLVRDGQTAVVEIALTGVPLELAGISVEAAAPEQTSSDAGLLALQRAAAAVSDGMSSQAIARAPDANAGEAVKRITGVTLFDGKFLVVRGLGERYSNALLNGAEMPNPVVEKKIAPLDLFPSSLIESVVAAKTATPDRPGDFAGGSVDLRTKEFPEGRVLEFTASQRWNDEATLRRLPIAGVSGTDWLGIDGGRRAAPVIPFGDPGPLGRQRVLQGFHDNVWDPAPRLVAPGMGFTASYGNQWQGTTRGLGAAVSLTYGNKTTYWDRLSNVYYYGREGATNVEWGGIANFSYKLSSGHKLSWKNLYTRSADQTTIFGQGSEGIALQRTYNLHYVERYLWQTQVTGTHQLRFLGNSQFEWTATYGRAHIDDPDNHTAVYKTALEPGAGTDLFGTRLTRRLVDYTRSGEAHWAFPLSLHRSADGLLKLGGYYRSKSRWFDAAEVHLFRDTTALASGLDAVVPGLPPNQAFAPENLSAYWTYVPSPNHDDSYQADDNLGAAYGMLDVPLIPAVRLVGGVRVEQWRLQLKPGYSDPEGSYNTQGRVIRKDHTDPLWSANLTIALSDRMNLRAAGYRTVARPDSREISQGQYTPLGGLGTCTEQGDASLDRSLITNADLRWELYPRPGELLALSAFYKYFKDPIVELRTIVSILPSFCTVSNEHSAEVRGGELELRRALEFLPGALGRLGLGINLTVVSSAIHFKPGHGLQARRFVGQSPFVLNAYLAYEPTDSWLNASLLFNYFGDRIKNYSNIETTPGQTAPNPNWVEQGRSSLDGKLRARLSTRTRLSLAGTNLLRAPVVIAEDSPPGRLIARYNPGFSVTAGLTYAF